MPQDKVKEFFEQVIKPNGFFNNENDFRAVLADEKQRKEFFDNALLPSGTFKVYDDFENTLDLKKKEVSEPSFQTWPQKSLEQGVGLGVKPISSTTSPSALKQPKPTTPSVSTKGGEPYVDVNFLKNTHEKILAGKATPEEFTKFLEEGQRNQDVIKEQEHQFANDPKYASLKFEKEAIDRGYKPQKDKQAWEQLADDMRTYRVDKYLSDDDKIEVQSLDNFKRLKQQGNETKANEELKKYLDVRAKMRQEVNAQIADLEHEKEVIQNAVQVGGDQELLAKIPEIDKEIEDIKTSQKQFYNPHMGMATFMAQNAGEIAKVSSPTETAYDRLNKYTSALYLQVEQQREKLGLDRDFEGMDRYMAERVLYDQGKEKELADLHNNELKLRNATKLLELNRTPIDNEGAWGVFGKTFVQTLAPFTSGKVGTDQAIARNLQDIVNGSDIDKAVNDEQKQLYGEKAEDYKTYGAKWFANATAPSAAIMAEFIPVTMLTEGLLSGSSTWKLISRLSEGGEELKLASAAVPYLRIMSQQKIGRGLLQALASGVRFGTESEAVAQVFPDQASQMNFMTGMFGGTMGSMAGQAGGKLLGSAWTMLTRMFGNKAPQAARIIADMGEVTTRIKDFSNNTIGEYFEEQGENLVNMYQSSDTYQKFMDQIVQHYGNLDNVTQEAVAILSMGFGAPAGSAIGRTMWDAGKRKYNSLTPSQKEKVDEIMNDLKSEDETAQKDAIKEANPELVQQSEKKTGQPTGQVEPQVEAPAEEVVEPAVVEEVKPEEVKPISSQVEEFGVPKEDVKPVTTLLDRVFKGLKRSGLTVANAVEDWVGIGKGTEKPYTLKINGKDTQVKNVSPEVVNGFYSPLEKTINDFKGDKLPVKQWIEKFGKGEEAKWTGLQDWLSQQEGSVSKEDIRKFLKENRVQIVEVVNTQTRGVDIGDFDLSSEPINEFEDGDLKFEDFKSSNGFTIVKTSKIGGKPFYSVYDKNDQSVATVGSVEELRDLKSQVDETKFSQYQLEGEKENYKEVLVTLPKSEPFILSKTSSFDTLNYAKNTYGVDSFEYRSIKNSVQNELEDKGLEYSKIKTLFEEYESYQKEFKSSHFEEPNILVHLRMNIRTDVDGNKVLFLEEVQSDWGQQGKREGFIVNKKQKEVKVRDLPNLKIEEEDFWDSVSISASEPNSNISRGLGRVTNISKNKYEAVQLTEQGVEKKIGEYRTRKEATDAVLDSKIFEGADKKTKSSIPSAPFVTDTNAWVKLGLKTALKEAIAQGVDKIAWTTGEQQNDRYDLSKQVSQIHYNKNEDGTYNVAAVGVVSQDVLFEKEDMTLSEVEAALGKDIAERISLGVGEKIGKGYKNEQLMSLSGEGLKVGGKGMIGFYGSPSEGKLGIIGQVAKSLFKQEPKTVQFKIKGKGEYTVGKSTEDVKIFSKRGDSFTYNGEPITKQRAYEIVEQGGQFESWSKSDTTQQSIDITPEMRKQVETQGQPLFKDADAQYRIESGKNIVEAIRKFDGSRKATVALTHEIMHPTVVAIIDGAKSGNETGKKHTQTIINEYNKANPKNKITIDELISGNDAFKSGKTSDKYRAVQEFIAESWEKYHLQGATGFSSEFQKVLDIITDAFRAVYKSLYGNEISPEIKQMFDEILGKEEISEGPKLKPEEESNLKSIEEKVGDNFRKIGNIYAKYGEGKPLSEITEKDYEKAVANKRSMNTKMRVEAFKALIKQEVGSAQADKAIDIAKRKDDKRFKEAEKLYEMLPDLRQQLLDNEEIKSIDCAWGIPK